MAEALSGADRPSHDRVLSDDGSVQSGLPADRDLDPTLGAVRAALRDATSDRFAPPDRG